MSDIQIGFWVFLQIAIDIILLVMIFVYLVRDRKRKPAPSFEEVNEEKLNVLSDSINQMIKESKRILNEMHERIEEQKRSLERMTEKLDRKKEEIDLSMKKVDGSLHRLKKDSDETFLTDDENHDKYQQVISLARKGLTVEEIEKRVQLPRGEVELILDLKKEGSNE